MDELHLVLRNKTIDIEFQDLEAQREKSAMKFYYVTSLIISFTLLCIVCLSSCTAIPARAEIVNMNIIKTIESSGNPLAIAKDGGIGLYQIMPCVLKEFNQFNKTTYTRQDLFNPLVNEQIAKWYLTKRIPQMLKYFHLPISTESVITCYNAGIRAVVKGYCPKITKNYIAKYARLQNAL